MNQGFNFSRNRPLKSETEIILEEYVIRMTASGLPMAALHTYSKKPVPTRFAENDIIEITDDEEDKSMVFSNMNRLDIFNQSDQYCSKATEDNSLTTKEFVLYQKEPEEVTNDSDVNNFKTPSSPLLIPIKYIDYEIDKILHPTPSHRPKGRPRKYANLFNNGLL
ncbi:hypothetical protein Trydic_g2456 [Trypoxylus dichotomus]